MTVIQRWIAAVGLCVTLAAGAILWLSMHRNSAALAAPPMPAASEDETDEDMRHTAPAADEATREARRLRRYDRDRDQLVSYDEYMLSRRKAFDKLDKNRDGLLSFEEYAVKTIDKFKAADRNKDRSLNAREFAATAQRKTKSD